MFRRLADMKLVFDQLMRQPLPMDDILNSDFSYEQEYVKYIDDQRRVHTASHYGDILRQSVEPVIKIEGFEKFSLELFMGCQGIAIKQGHYGPVTAHLFISPADGLSFPMHTDPDDVIIVMLEGSKRFCGHDEDQLLVAGDFMLIPKNYPHRAINVTDNLMLSVGLESFTVEKL